MKKIFFVLLLSITSLFALEDITSSNFDDKVRGKNVILDFYTTW
jgi:thioredoxin 1